MKVQHQLSTKPSLQQLQQQTQQQNQPLNSAKHKQQPSYEFGPNYFIVTPPASTNAQAILSQKKNIKAGFIPNKIQQSYNKGVQQNKKPKEIITQQSLTKDTQSSSYRVGNLQTQASLNDGQQTQQEPKPQQQQQYQKNYTNTLIQEIISQKRLMALGPNVATPQKQKVRVIVQKSNKSSGIESQGATTTNTFVGTNFKRDMNTIDAQLSYQSSMKSINQPQTVNKQETLNNGNKESMKIPNTIHSNTKGLQNHTNMRNIIAQRAMSNLIQQKQQEIQRHFQQKQQVAIKKQQEKLDQLSPTKFKIVPSPTQISKQPSQTSIPQQSSQYHHDMSPEVKVEPMEEDLLQISLRQTSRKDLHLHGDQDHEDYSMPKNTWKLEDFSSRKLISDLQSDNSEAPEENPLSTYYQYYNSSIVQNEASANDFPKQTQNFTVKRNTNYLFSQSTITPQAQLSKDSNPFGVSSVNNKGQDYNKSQTVVKQEDDNKSDCYQMSPQANDKISSTTSTNGRKRVQIRKFKYKNLTETQTPSDRSMLTGGQGSGAGTPLSHNTSIGKIYAKRENTNVDSKYYQITKSDFKYVDENRRISLPVQKSRPIVMNFVPTPREEETFEPVKNKTATPSSNNSSRHSKSVPSKSSSVSSSVDSQDDCSIIEQEELLASSLPKIRGTVYKKIVDPKKAQATAHGLKKRYGLVRNKKFKYYKDKDMKILGGVFDFDRINCVIMIDDGSGAMGEYDASPLGHSEIDRHSSSTRYSEPKRFRIEVQGCSTQFLFQVHNSATLREWTQALYANWHASRSFNLYDVISQADFRKIADTGDILLFTGTSFVTRVQRALTMSEYDHVAMLLRYSNGKLVMFESTGSTGVAVLDWDAFVKNGWNKIYSKLSFRKLRHNRTLESMQKLEQFIRTVIGMKYRLNPSKIFRKKFENDSENISEDKSYFCSELVASAYKCLGLLPKDISASQYWPGSFSSKSDLKLIGEGLLEDEQMIEFEEVVQEEGKQKEEEEEQSVKK